MRSSQFVRGLAVVVAGAILIAGGVSVASNMGFKFVPSIAANKAFNLSLPWNNNYTDAKSLYNDIPGVSRVTRYNGNATLTNWDPTQPTANNFPIVKGNAYIVTAGGGGVSSAVIVGSHDPSFTFTFTANQARNSSAPYHQTFTTASQLYNDLVAQLGSGKISRVTRYNDNATLTNWDPTQPTANNFPMTLGMGVIVFASAGGSGYTWPHY